MASRTLASITLLCMRASAIRNSHVTCACGTRARRGSAWHCWRQASGARRQLAPGERMAASETWTLLPYDGPDARAAQLDFLRAHAQALGLAGIGAAR